MNLSIRTFTGQAAVPYIPELARLRMTVFREFPYLYDGSIEEEKEYLSTFMQASDSILVVAFDGRRVIGASTALPMLHETANVQKPFLESGYELSAIFYFGESVLEKPYRGKGLGLRFFEERSRHAAQFTGVKLLTFCGIQRPLDHPLRPDDYKDLDDFWRNRGFEPTSMSCLMSWKDINEISETDKSLKFWIKPLK